MSATSVERFTVSLESGGTLDVATCGPEHAVPLIFHHGTPMSLILFEPFIQAAVTQGLRYVSYTRPGYGNSTRQPDRIVADCSKDTQAVLDQLDADRCYVVGWSGGGPHALASAALLPKRVIAVSTIASIAPWKAQGLDWLAGMGKENIEEFHAALAGTDQLGSFLEHVAPVLAQITPSQIVVALGDLIDERDKAALGGRGGAFLAENCREALRNGFWGWFDDDIAFAQDWGFDLSEINVPVSVWQGTKDRMVPSAHGLWLASRITGARSHLLGEHRHISLPLNGFREILGELIA